MSDDMFSRLDAEDYGERIHPTFAIDEAGDHGNCAESIRAAAEDPEDREADLYAKFEEACRKAKIIAAVTGAMTERQRELFFLTTLYGVTNLSRIAERWGVDHTTIRDIKAAMQEKIKKFR